MLERMQGSRARYLVPNGITFLSLACGVAAILASAADQLDTAGALILISYILDLFDGELARRLQAGSSFGLQLDSLVDMVSLGTAPAILAFSYLQDSLRENNLQWTLLWLLTILYTLAGAFRLARFNLLPMKQGQTASLGLTISTSGATLALAVVSHQVTGAVAPPVLFLPLLLLLSLLMVQPHPPTLRSPGSFPIAWSTCSISLTSPLPFSSSGCRPSPSGFSSTLAMWGPR